RKPPSGLIGEVTDDCIIRLSDEVLALIISLDSTSAIGGSPFPSIVTIPVRVEAECMGIFNPVTSSSLTSKEIGSPYVLLTRSFSGATTYLPGNAFRIL